MRARYEVRTLLLVLVGLAACGRTSPPVTLSVRNPPNAAGQIVVVQGDPVRVEFSLSGDPAPDASDSIQLRRLDDENVVSQKSTGGVSSGTAWLDSGSDLAVGRLEVVYVRPPRGVLGTAERTVWVVETSPTVPKSVVVPSPQAPTIQAGIDLVAPSGLVSVGPGVYEETLFIVGKEIRLVGSGTAKKGSATVIRGPVPEQVLPADAVLGNLNIGPGGGGLIKGMVIAGGQAGILGFAQDGRAPAAVRLEDMVLEENGRGIAWFAPSQLTVADTTIEDSAWNGISVAPRLAQLPPGLPVFVIVKAVVMIEPDGAGIYFEDAFLLLRDVWVHSAETGGIVGVRCGLDVVDSHIMFNHKFGIELQWCGGGELYEVTIRDNLIGPTRMTSREVLGDGVGLIESVATLIDNRIVHSDRVGVSLFGGSARLSGNEIKCAAIDMAGNPGMFNGQDPVFVDLESNLCGCGAVDPLGDCSMESAEMEPPEPIGGIE